MRLLPSLAPALGAHAARTGTGPPLAPLSCPPPAPSRWATSPAASGWPRPTPPPSPSAPWASAIG